MWVENAQRDHADFVNKLRERGVEVVELHDLLAETMAIPEAKAWLLDRKIIAERGRASGWSTTPARSSSRSTPRELAEYLIGGLATADLPDDFRTGYVALARESTGVREYLMPPLPNTLYTRDTTCWLYGGVTLNPLYWPARHDETLLMKAIYQFHPDFVGSTVWWGDPEQDWGQATFEGGDIMPVGNGVVLMGMSERTSRQAITQVAAALFEQGAAERVDRRRDAQAARRDAPRHGLHLRRPRHRDRCTRHRGRRSTRSPCAPATRRRASRSPTEGTAVRRRRRRGARPARAAGHRDRRRRLRLRAPAVGQRQQRRRRRARRGVHLRPQHADQHRCCARPASRSSRSSAPSSAAAAAAATA